MKRLLENSRTNDRLFSEYDYFSLEQIHGHPYTLTVCGMFAIDIKNIFNLLASS